MELNEENIEACDDKGCLQNWLESSEDLALRRLLRSKIRILNQQDKTTITKTDTTLPTKKFPTLLPSQEQQAMFTKTPSSRITDATMATNATIATTATKTHNISTATNSSVPKRFNVNTSSSSLIVSSKTFGLDTCGSSGRREGKNDFRFVMPTLRAVGQMKKTTLESPSKINDSSKNAFQMFKDLDQINQSERAPVCRKASWRMERPNSIRSQMLAWCQNRLENYPGVHIEDFSASWGDGLAFCALVHSFHPTAFYFDSLDVNNKRGNLKLAFETAERLSDVAILLDIDDMLATDNPDWHCVFTYVCTLANRMTEQRRALSNSDNKPPSNDHHGDRLPRASARKPAPSNQPPGNPSNEHQGDGQPVPSNSHRGSCYDDVFE